MPKLISWILLLGWAALLLMAILLYGDRQLSEFDPQGTLIHHSTDPGFDSKVTHIMQNYGVEASTLVHIVSERNCYCDTLAAPHQIQLLNKLGNPDYSTTTIALEQLPELAEILPSTPALIIIDSDYRLRYLGPYATGYGCFTGKDLVDEISQYATTPNYIGGVIKSDAEGCFCHN